MLRPLHKLLILLGLQPKDEWLGPPEKIRMVGKNRPDYEIGQVVLRYNNVYQVVSKDRKSTTMEKVS